MNEQFNNQDLIHYLLRLADSSLTLGQRLSEWCGHGPYLEEDIAITNVSLDYFGHANLLYGLAASQMKNGTSADDLAFLRDVHEFKNPIITELPKGDFAFTMLRQYLIDVYNQLLYTRLAESKSEDLSDIAKKAIKESHYHAERSELWIERLALGTVESCQRLQQALNDLWFYTPELFETDDSIDRLINQQVVPDLKQMKQHWEKQVIPFLTQTCQLVLPETGWVATGGLNGEHSEHLGYMLSEMQFLQRAYPGCEW